MTVFGNFDARFPAMFALNCAIMLALSLLNDAAAGVSAYVYAPALMLVAPSLFLGRWGAFAMGVAVGFMFSAWAPVRDGAQAALFGAACLAVHGLRHKFRNLDPMGIMWLTWGVNMALYFASVAFIFPAGVAGAGAYAARVAVDAVFSSAAAALFSAYAVNLFRSVFFIFGVNLSVGED